MSAGAQDAAWMAAARPVGEFCCDAFFLLAQDLYVGPTDGMAPAHWRTERVALPPHGLPCRIAERFATADLPGREDALARYYATLIEVARAHGKLAGLARPFPCFAVRPGIVAGPEVLASWPWSDSVSEASGVLATLARSGAAAPGTAILDDEDQGWRLRLVAGEGHLHGVEWDGEGPPPAGGAWRLDLDALAAQAADAAARLRAAHAMLVRRLGRDYWA